MNPALRETIEREVKFAVDQYIKSLEEHTPDSTIGIEPELRECATEIATIKCQASHNVPHIGYNYYNLFWNDVNTVGRYAKALKDEAQATGRVTIKLQKHQIQGIRERAAKRRGRGFPTNPEYRKRLRDSGEYEDTAKHYDESLVIEANKV